MSFKEEGLLLSGTVYIHLLDEESHGFEELGNTTDMKITFASKAIERKSKKKGQIGQILDSITQPEPTKLDMTIDTFNPKNMSLAMMGTLGYEKITSETITDEVVTAELERWLPLAKAPIKPSTVKVKLANGSPVTADKFEIKEDAGMIYLKENAGAAKGEKIKVTYDTADSDAWTIAAGTKSQFKCELLLDGINLATNRAVQVRIPRATIAANGALGFITDEFNSMAFTGTPELVTGEKSSVIMTMA